MFVLLVLFIALRDLGSWRVSRLDCLERVMKQVVVGVFSSIIVEPCIRKMEHASLAEPG